MTDMPDWQFPPEKINLTDRDVHIWQIFLEEPIEKAKDMGWILSDEEKYRAGRFQFEHHQRRFLISHAALRHILSQYTGIEPQHIQYQITSYGKPHLRNKTEFDIQFNLSHSHERAVVAICQNQPIGIDIEYIRSTADIASLAKQNFSTNEYQQFAKLPVTDSLLGFFNTWTRKEAYIKAIGEGLSHPLHTFEVTVNPGEPAQMLSIANDLKAARHWTLEAVQVQDGYAAAFAVQLTKVYLNQWIYQIS